MSSPFFGGGEGGGGHKNQLSIVFLVFHLFLYRSLAVFFRFTLSKKVVLSIPRCRVVLLRSYLECTLGHMSRDYSSSALR